MSKPSSRTITLSLLVAGLALALGLFVLRRGAGEAIDKGAAIAQSSSEHREQTNARDQREQIENAGKVEIEEQADRLLRQMGSYLGKIKSLSVSVDHIIEVTTEAGEKLQFDATSEVMVKRPNKLRTNRRGQLADVSFYYDGKTLTIYGRRLQMFASVKAPPSLDEAITFGRDALGLEAPGADLLFSDPYEYLREDAVSGRYIGSTTIRGVTCSHLAFRNQDTDWQIWIAEGSAPLPCKYVVTSKDIPGAPAFSVVFYDWNTQPEFSDEIFRFTPPEGAEKIDFLGLQEE